MSTDVSNAHHWVSVPTMASIGAFERCQQCDLRSFTFPDDTRPWLTDGRSNWIGEYEPPPCPRTATY